MITFDIRTIVSRTVLVLVIGAAPAAARVAAEEDAAALVAAIEAAERSGDAAAAVEALRDAAQADSPEVARAVARAAASANRAVKSCALETLGWIRNRESLESLHRIYRQEKSIREDESLFVTLLKAIGRHGDPSSVAVLSDSPFDHLTLATGRARIMGLANIRTKESARALVEAMRLAGSDRGGARARSGQPLMPAFRAALTILCGTDRGPTKEEWQAYWREAEKGASPVGAKRPAVPPFAREAWREFWGEPYVAEHGETTPSSAASAAAAAPEIVASPTPEQVAAALAALESAVKSGDESAHLEALERARLVVDPKVIAEIAKGVRSRSCAVQAAALDALGRIPHPDALRVLHETYRRDKSIRDDEHLLPKLLKAIGRHADRSSIEILAVKPLRNLTRESGTARIYGLARIRDAASVEALMKAMTLGGSPRTGAGGSRSSGPRFLEEMRVGLCILTGEDHGASKEAWLAWWQKAKKSFRPSATIPEVPPLVRTTFDEYWD